MPLPLQDHPFRAWDGRGDGIGGQLKELRAATDQDQP